MAETSSLRSGAGSAIRVDGPATAKLHGTMRPPRTAERRRR